MWKHNGYVNIYNILLETMKYHTSKVDPMYKKIGNLLNKILYIIPELNNQIVSIIESSGMLKHPEILKMIQ
jgi:transcription antitermination factor NusA-like protein